MTTKKKKNITLSAIAGAIVIITTIGANFSTIASFFSSSKATSTINSSVISSSSGAFALVGSPITNTGALALGPNATAILTINNAPSSTPPSAQDIDSLQPDETLAIFKQHLGPPQTQGEPWYDTSGQEYYEYIFEGPVPGGHSVNSTYYIQAVTESNSDDANVVFWSLTICNPSTTFAITDPASGKQVILNQSTLADIFQVSDNVIGDLDEGDTTLHYTLGGNIFETQQEHPGGDRLYVGVNLSCPSLRFVDHYFTFLTSTGTYIFAPQHLGEVIDTPGLSAYRESTKINMVGMSGWDDEEVYAFFQSMISDGRSHVGYDIPESNN